MSTLALPPELGPRTSRGRQTPTISGSGARVFVPLRARGTTSLVGLGVLLAATAALYLPNLSASGWANAYYSAAAQAGASDWTAMLFGSSDAANAITIDKTPAALWVIDVSVRLFGLNPWSVLVPQALEGVAAVALLYAAVRRVSGDGAAFLAGAVFALAPTAALIFRFQQSRRAAGVAAGRGRVLRSARLREGQQPSVADRRGRLGRLRISGQDAAGVLGGARFRRGVPGRRSPSDAAPGRRPACRRRCHGGIRRLVPVAC